MAESQLPRSGTGRKPSKKSRKSILNAALLGNADELVRLSKGGGVDITVARDKDGNSPLHTAADSGNTGIINMLIGAGVPADVKNKVGNTSLHLAALNGRTNAIKLLLAAGVSVDIKNNAGNTPLTFAVMDGRASTVKYFVKVANADSSKVPQELQLRLNQLLTEKEEDVTESLHSPQQGGNKETPREEEASTTASAEEDERDNEGTPREEETSTKASAEKDERDNEGTPREEEVSTTASAEEDDSDNEETEREDTAYAMALTEGEASSSSISIYILGQEKSGKTCLTSTLLGDTFKENIATQGADVNICTVYTTNWSRVAKDKISEKLQNAFHTKLTKLKVTAEIKLSAADLGPIRTASNKLQLQKSLPKLPAAIKADLEQAKAAVLVNGDGIDAIIWDFAGQSVYHGLHSMFLKEDNVAMVVFDASQSLHDPTQGRNVVRDPYTKKDVNPTTTGAETVCYWLKAIHSICHKDGTKHNSKSKFLPVVYLVATHIDKVGDKMAISKRKKEIIDCLFLLLQTKPYAQHLAGIGEGLRNALEKYCFFISNKDTDKKELDRLKAELTEASQHILIQKHPVVYLNIEKELFATNKAVITTNEFHTITNNCGFFAAMDSKEFKGALLHFHNKGTILHFPNTESLREVVVLSPQWLAKLFAYVIVAHPYKLDSSRHDAQYRRLRNHGILVEDFISCMVEKFNKDQKQFGFPLSTKQAIEFVELFGFVAEVNNSIYFLEEEFQLPKQQTRVFIVPPMLPWDLPQPSSKLPADKDKNACIVYFKFPDNFIPLMVFYQMLATCIDRNIKQEEDLYILRRHMIKLVLGSDQYYYVSNDNDCIRLVVSPDEDGVVSVAGLQDRWNLIAFFSTKLMEISATFMPASAPPECYIPCSLCPNLHLKLDEIRANQKPLRCLKGKLHPDYYKHLRQYPAESEVKLDSGTISAEGDNSLPLWVSNKVPNLQKLARYLKPLSDWINFGIYLLPEDQGHHWIEQIRINNEGKGVASCKIELYRKYLECGEKRWQKVLDALEESEHTNLADEVKEKLLKEFSKQ
ncbi:uncharacterized protein [Dysidea avara]|uniref:uncharacterized protein isoform X2 n=1 Tax=Dysidea avara TaxID=196820 RepID=UPI00331E4244